MADNARGRLWKRLHYWQRMRSNGAWASFFTLPTLEDYRRFLVVNTEGPMTVVQNGWDDIHALRVEQQRIDTTIQQLRVEIQDVAELGAERAWVIEKEGLQVGQDLGIPPKEQLYTGGQDSSYVAPKLHPVWADELRHDSHILRQMGDMPLHPLRDWETNVEQWPTAHDGADLFEAEAPGRVVVDLQTHTMTDVTARQSESQPATSSEEYRLQSASAVAQGVLTSVCERFRLEPQHDVHHQLTTLQDRLDQLRPSAQTRSQEQRRDQGMGL